MSDRMWAKMTIGGPLRRADIDDFVDALDGCADRSDVDFAIAENIPLEIEDEEAAYGSFYVEDKCRALGLSYCVTSDAKYEWDAGDKWWLPGFGPDEDSQKYNTHNANHFIMVSLEKVRELLAMDRAAAEAYLNDLVPPEIPPLTLVD